MKWLISEDEFYYTAAGTTELKELYGDTVKRFITLPDLETIQNEIKNGKNELDKIAFLAPYTPSKVSPLFSDNFFFEILPLKNKGANGLTTGQAREGITLDKVLSAKLGVKMEYSNYTMADYSGAYPLHEQVMIIEEKFRHGIPTKGFFLTGIPGGGKSLFAKCVAGELGYMLVSLSLSKFKEKDDPIHALASFFSYFENAEGKYVIWIDEIEKMLKGENSQDIIGEMLTSINELNNKGSSSFFIIATANNVKKLTDENPELFRNGRFDLVLFVKNPTKEDAKEIFNLYINKQKKFFIDSFIPFAIYDFAIITTGKLKKARIYKHRSYQIAKDFFETYNMNHTFVIKEVSEFESKEKFAIHFHQSKEAVEIMNILKNNYEFKFNIDQYIRASAERYREQSSMRDRYVYTPAEIEFIVTDSFQRYYLVENEPENNIDFFLERYKPLQISMPEGVKEILALSTNFMEI